MAPRLGPTAILSTVVACVIGLTMVAGWSERPSRDCLEIPPGVTAFKGLERITPAGRHEWFDGRCWTTTPHPPYDRGIQDLYRSQPGQVRPSQGFMPWRER